MSLAVFYVITAGVHKKGKKQLCVAFLRLLHQNSFIHHHPQHVYVYTGLLLFYFLTDILTQGNSKGSVSALKFCVDS